MNVGLRISFVIAMQPVLTLTEVTSVPVTLGLQEMVQCVLVSKAVGKMYM